MTILDSKRDALKNIQFITMKNPRKKESEDSFFINDDLGIYGVMDGATPIDDFIDKDGHNGAYLASNLFKNYFESLIDIEYLHEEVLRANQLLRNTMKDYKINQKDKTKLWCSCISAVQLKNNALLYASIGDTMIIIVDNNDEINVLTRDSVKNINMRSQLQRNIERNQNMDIPEESYFQNKRNKIAYNRKMANKPNGYAVANGMKEVEDYIQYGMLDTKDLNQVLIMSDGLFGTKKNLISVYHEVKKVGLETYIQELTDYEENNNKSSDDKTAILLTFQ